LLVNKEEQKTHGLHCERTSHCNASCSLAHLYHKGYKIGLP